MSWRAEHGQRVASWMRAWAQGRASDHDFESLATNLHAQQVANIAAFGAYCRSRGVAEAGWRRLPCVPVGAYKIAELFASPPFAEARLRFETSGTSDGRPGAIELSDSALYDLSLRAGFHHFVVPDASLRLDDQPQPPEFRLLSLVPDERTRPHSSLGHMVRVVADTWAAGEVTQLLVPAASAPGGGEIWIDPLVEAASRPGPPVLLMATSLALDQLQQRWPRELRVQLPAGSRLMDTGGPKGRILSVSRDEQHQWLQEHLGLERELIVGELGMTELASQRYEGSVRAHFFGEVAPRERYLGPPWLRSVALAAQSLTPCGPGEEGMLAHVDLANVEPCAFVLTADRGRVFPTALADSVELLGRVPGSEWRGCGLDVEQLLSVGD